MTKEEILAMEAGGELDKVIHGVVMELCVHEWEVAEISKRRHFATGGACKRCSVSPLFAYSKYSTDISAAWQVLRRLREEFWCIEIRIADGCLVIMELLRTSPIRVEVNAGTPFEKLPEAICKAALLAKLEVGK